MTAADGRPGRAGRVRGKWTALILALVVNLLFVAVLVFSVSWQNRAPPAVTAELYAPPAKVAPTPVPPRPQPPPQPQPQPVPRPAPPVPKPPAPVVEKPDQREADIALKAKQAALQKQQQEAAERERLQKEQARKDAEAKKLAEQQVRAVEAMRAQAQRESQLRSQAELDAQMRAQAERESQMRAEAEREAQARAEQAAASDARNKAEADWIDRIRSKIRSNVIVPPDIQGNPEAVFDVVQLPTGEIIDVQLRASSGVPAYDNAVQRAILKSSPLPKPATPDLFERRLRLRFRPHDR
ncbi:MAG: cell envelope integrity protein TolA [Betaproteobacteria bacterium]|nr:cell envelope integrity protein TolA [Betaproteobacteria bacterium]